VEECDAEQEPAGLPRLEEDLVFLENYSFSVLLSREGDLVYGLPRKDFGFQHIEIDFELSVAGNHGALVGVVGYDSLQNSSNMPLRLEDDNMWFFDIGDFF
jgi:hypothetical protein